MRSACSFSSSTPPCTLLLLEVSDGKYSRLLSTLALDSAAEGVECGRSAKPVEGYSSSSVLSTPLLLLTAPCLNEGGEWKLGAQKGLFTGLLTTITASTLPLRSARRPADSTGPSIESSLSVPALLLRRRCGVRVEEEGAASLSAGPAPLLL